jgi:hypothetical protein
MPPLAHSKLDEQGLALLRQWIESLPGPPVTSPPKISPSGGNYEKTIKVTLSSTEPDTIIRYTIDGSVPTKNDPIYEKPIELTGPTVIRAKSFKTGFTKSITVQEIFTVTP